MIKERNGGRCAIRRASPSRHQLSGVDVACDRFEATGVTLVDRPNEGKMKEIAFSADPDGYWIRFLSAAKRTAAVETQERR